MLRRIAIGFALTLITSAYFFPISFTFLPTSINSKMLVAVFGILAFVLHSIRSRGMRFSEPTVFSFLMAAVFSVWCLFCVTESNTYDTIYATYLISFITWLAGAYGVYAALSLFYEKVDLEILVRFLALVGVYQCVTAVIIDNNAGFASFVDRFMDQEQDFYKRGGRLYGIGAALDPAGIRFSVILVMMAHLFSTHPNVRNSRINQSTLLAAYAVIMIIGSVISRTTTVGAGLGIVYIILSLIRMRKGGFVTTSMVQSFFWFFIVLIVIILFVIRFYQTSDTFRAYLRFGFEAFFNWVETGDFHTTSTDTLQNDMWIWPNDLRTWLIGRGTFGVFDNNTDIGYCNFTLYCGLIGLVIFSLYFIYCHWAQTRKFKDFEITALMLTALTFIIWIKVTTDIFFIDALLFCIVGDKDQAAEAEGEKIQAEESRGPSKLYFR